MLLKTPFACKFPAAGLALRLLLEMDRNLQMNELANVKRVKKQAALKDTNQVIASTMYLQVSFARKLFWAIFASEWLLFLEGNK